MKPVSRVTQRRRRMMSIGFAVMALASTVGPLACIFDKGGDYQGGGRLDHGGTGKQVTSESASASASESPTSEQDADSFEVGPPDVGPQ